MQPRTGAFKSSRILYTSISEHSTVIVTVIKNNTDYVLYTQRD